MKINTSAKMSEVGECLCRNFIPVRMTSYDRKKKKYECVLQCMTCGRNSFGEAPRACVDNWNKANTQLAIKEGVL